MCDPNNDDVIDHGNGISTGGRSLVSQLPEGVFDHDCEEAYREAMRTLPSVSEAPPGVFLTGE